ncbi:zinc-binding protein A33-like isoform X2 [Ambystoma mexicanum]|uniref:zinc-binding protein A33-like isoform X2 n=1 Tax=Ambystoma mexicanum TaxID=8296 RepID=UPI0037E9C5A4
MASGRYPEPSLKEELTCSICCDLFTDPVMLDCMHHFCKKCILRFWQGSERASCPHCRRESPTKAFRTNYILARVVDRVRRCSTEEHQRKVQKQLEDATRFHQQRIEHMEAMKQIAEERIARVKKTTRDLSVKIQEDFQWLHQILQEEESSTLEELREDEEKALSVLRYHIRDLQEGISELENSVKGITQIMGTNGDPFLVEVENLKSKPSAPMAPQPYINTDVWMAKYCGPLQYTKWRKMLKSIRPAPAPLTFDKETAHPNLIFSADLRQVTEVPKPHVAEVGPKCFQQCVNVLASESFRSGCHYWEVWVGSKTKWDLGVAADYVDRTTKVKLCPENGYWALRLRNSTQYWAATNPWTKVLLKKCPRKVGIYLSCEEGRVGFYDAEDMTHLFTFQNAQADRFFPFFSTCFSDGQLNREPMRICHVNL